MIGWHPDVAVWVLVVGILLIYFECNRPGWVVPGCVGGLMVLLSGYSLGRLPLNFVGLALCAGAVGLILVSVVSSARDLIAVTGIVMLVWGLRMLVQPNGGERVHLSAAAVTGVCFGFVTRWLADITMRARRNKQSASRQTEPWKGTMKAAAVSGPTHERID